MADTRNISELQTADLTQQELAEKQERANKQKSQNEAAMAFTKYYRDKDASLTEWRRVGDEIVNPQTGLFTGSDHDLKKLGPGIYERTGGACRVAYGKDGMIRPLANDLDDLGKRTVLFGSERLLFNKNFDQPTSAYAARFDQAWGEVINFGVTGRQAQVIPIHYTGQVGYAPLILMLELCKKKGVGVDIKDDNIQNFLANMLAGGPDFLLTATTQRGRAKQRAKNIAIAERIIALEKEVNANYAEKLKPFEEQQGYLRSKEQLEKNEKLPTDPEKRAAAIQDLLKDKDGNPLSTEEKTKVLEAQVQSLNERAEALANKKVEITNTLDANTEKLNQIESGDPSVTEADIERMKDVMTGPVADARNGLLDAMKEESDDLMARRELLVEELNDIPPPAPPREAEEQNIARMKDEIEVESNSMDVAPEPPPPDEDIMHAVPDDLPPPPSPPPPRDDAGIDDMDLKPDFEIPVAPPPPRNEADTVEKPVPNSPLPEPTQLEKLQQKMVEAGKKLEKVADPARNIEKIKAEAQELAEKVHAQNENVNTNTKRP
jgi:hypothetical protein